MFAEPKQCDDIRLRPRDAANAPEKPLALNTDRRRLTRPAPWATEHSYMTHFFTIVAVSLAAAAVFTLSIPADAATTDWELPFSVAP